MNKFYNYFRTFHLKKNSTASGNNQEKNIYLVDNKGDFDSESNAAGISNSKLKNVALPQAILKPNVCAVQNEIYLSAFYTVGNTYIAPYNNLATF